MDPAVPKATLKVLGLCVMLLVLVAAVTVSVAVMVWRSEAVGKLRGCRERAANESRELGNRVAELERDRTRLQQAAAAAARAEDALRRELVQARGDGKKLNVSLASCRERAVAAAEAGAGAELPFLSSQARLEANVTALGNEVLALRRARAELARGKAALQGELHPPGSSGVGRRSPPVTPLKQLTRGVPQPFGQRPAEGARVWGARVTPAVPFVPQRSWRRARRRRWGCGSGWRQRWSSSERCGRAGSNARPGRESSKPPYGTTRPRSTRCGGGGRGTERPGAGAPRPGKAEAPQTPRPPPCRGLGAGHPPQPQRRAHHSQSHSAP
ncbi:uncharacterized protein LOC142035347 [Buteo buteo]|uniref:uncharacterized protein LOC142035347 n=1 Tax=Buteo buteo TaxID=30397 RepID=UPI003EB75DBA